MVLIFKPIPFFVNTSFSKEDTYSLDVWISSNLRCSQARLCLNVLHSQTLSAKATEMELICFLFLFLFIVKAPLDLFSILLTTI